MLVITIRQVLRKKIVFHLAVVFSVCTFAAIFSKVYKKTQLQNLDLKIFTSVHSQSIHVDVCVLV